jgi:hypothetical protein
MLRRLTGFSWIGKVWFSFYGIWELLEVLPTLPTTTLSKIRLLRVLTPNARYTVPDRSTRGTAYYDCTLDSVFRLLPGLQLDKLVVFGLSYQTYAPAKDDQILTNLVTHSDGWKELNYICPDSAMLAYDTAGMVRTISMPQLGRTGPQPQRWKDLSNAWDASRGGATGPSTVTIFRAQLFNDLGSSVFDFASSGSQDETPVLENWLDCGWAKDVHGIVNPDRYDWLGTSTAWCPYSGHSYAGTSELFEQEMPQGSSPLTYGQLTDDFLMQDEECWKGLRIVIKRGPGVDYTATGRPSPLNVYLSGNRRGSPLVATGFLGDHTWAKMRPYGHTNKLSPVQF